MKFFAPILMAVVAVFSAQVDANGVCYDPDHTTSKSASTVAADMETIAGYGFTSVRTYISMFGTTEMGPIITAAGLTAALGVPYPQSDYEDQMAAAISAANSGGVAYIFVGNENLAGASSVPSTMISVIESIKSQVPDSVKVGTVQRNTEVINYSSISGWSDLVSACDVLGVNVHPFFTSGTTADDAINVVNTQWETMMGNFGDKLLLTETGWPSSGSYSGNTGSSSGTETFYGDYQSWSSGLSEKFYFQMFDTPSKSEAYEQTFGLLTYDSQSKFTMSTTQTTTTTSAPTTSAPTTQAPTTEAPTTEAPTTEAPATEAPATEAPATEAPATEAPATEAPTATPEVTTEAPAVYSASASASVAGEADYNSTDASTSSSESVGLGSASLSDEEVGSSSSSSYGVDVSDESVADDADTESVQSTTTKSSTATAGTSSTGTSSDAQKTTGQDGGSAQEASTQSSGSSAGTTVGIAVAGGACAVLMAFGFIYQTRKRAQDLEAAEEKRESFSAMTPVENICAL